MIDIPILKWLKLESYNTIIRNNFGNRGYADGNKEEQYTGILGQNVVLN